MADATAMWRDAFEGEALGAALFGRLADLTSDDDRRAKLAVLQRLEGSTLELLRPVLERLGIPTDGETTAAESGAQFGEAASAQPWEQLLASFAEYGEVQRSLRPAPTPRRRRGRPDRRCLLAHERALCEFARRELAGEPYALRPILDLPHVAASTPSAEE